MDQTNLMITKLTKTFPGRERGNKNKKINQ